MKMKNKKQIIKYSSISLLFTGVAVSSFVVPIVININKRQTPLPDYSDTLVGNKNKVDDFLSNSNLISYSLLQNSLEIYGKDGLIGKSDEKLTPDQRSFITIETAWRNNLFRLNLSSKMYYELYNRGLSVELGYVKPNKNDSTSPTVGIRFSSGKNQNKYSRIYEYNENYLYGFQKSNVDTDINQTINIIKEKPTEFFTLKSEKGKIGDVGVYAKNIIVDDLTTNTNTEEMKKIIEKEYFISITNVKVDTFVPSKLIVSYNISYRDVFVKTNEKIELNGFDIEQGVDDPVSRVKNFIKKDDSLLKTLHQYFKYKAPEKKITIEQAYKDNLFSLELNSNAKYSLEKEGIDISFDLYDESKKEINAYANVNDSTSPIFIVNVTSYKNQGNEYTEKYKVEGIDQKGEFEVSEEEKKVEALTNYILDNNILTQDYLSIDLTLKGEFEKTTKDKVPFSFVLKSFEKYKDDDYNNRKAPFEIKLSKINNLPNNEMNSILDEIIVNTNKYDIKDIIQEIKIVNNKINVSVSYGLGDKDKNQYLELIEQFVFEDVFNDFMNERQYFANQVNTEKNRLEKNPNELIINYVNNQTFTELFAISKMRENRLNEIFSGVSILNPNPLEYPEYDTQISVAIDFNWWLERKYEEIEKWITDKKLTFKINVYKEGSALSSFNLEKNFSDLFTS